MIIGYLGPEGSYSYEAALSYTEKASLEKMHTFREIIEGVEKGTIDIGVLPIENSTEGAVTQVMDGLLTMSLASIQGELIQQIHHHLLSKGKLDDLIHVFSHPQAIEQCREFFYHKMPHITLIPCKSSSDACRIVSEKGVEYGAIASESAGIIHGLKTIAADIEDNSYNQTRFIIIGRDKTVVTGNDKTSIAFSFYDDHPGSLFQVLKEFATENINLTRVESRPAKAELGKYVFYIDFIGHIKDEAVIRVMNNVKIITNKFVVFGSYPIGINI